MLQPMHIVDQRATSYATVADFLNTLTEELHRLNLLSLLLTADTNKAEHCLVCAMGECVEGNVVFLEWARSWARRAVLKYAIQMIKPLPEHPDSLPFIRSKEPATSTENNPFAAIVALGAFERFVFVMSVLEGQSDGDCLSLLRCSRREIKIARELVFSFLETIDAGGDHLQEALRAWRRFLSLEYPV